MPGPAIPGHADLSCLYTIWQNISGSTFFFGFLPPHGVKLLANEEYTTFGPPSEAVVRSTRRGARRNIQALETAIEQGWIKIVVTPALLLQDAVTGNTKMLKLSGGVLSTVDPCWTTSVPTTNINIYAVGSEAFVN
jgi:hypothetical protein